MGACLMGLRICPGKKSPETAELIRKLLDWLEVTKKANADNEGIANETAAQAMIEEYALKMFEKADELDRQEIFNKYDLFKNSTGITELQLSLGSGFMPKLKH